MVVADYVCVCNPGCCVCLYGWLARLRLFGVVLDLELFEFALLMIAAG